MMFNPHSPQRLYWFLLLITLTPTIGFGQLTFYHSNEIEVSADNAPLKLPWAGGLNNPQFSNMDFNGDGIQDLFIFDRSNRKMLTLIHDAGGNTDFTLDFSYDTAFPEVDNWALMRDYNCDGYMDLFTYRSSGIRLFENNGSISNPAFELRSDFIFSDADLGGGPISFGLYVSAVDIPGIDDIDNDGDLDIITFTQSGTTVQLYINQSMELFGDCDSLAYVLGNNCYGMFAESIISEELFLGDEAICPFNVVNPIRSGGAHSGSSICIVDTDQNGYKDLILGDISATGVSLLSLGGSSSSLDSAFASTPNYPPLPITIDTEFFPTAYYVDVDNDGINDLLASPSNKNESVDTEGSYYFKNNGENDLLEPEYVQNNFLIDEMIDVGTAAYPHAVDYNGDGLVDLIISNKGYYELGGNYTSQLMLLVNTGTSTNPQFNIVDSDYLNLSTSELGRYLFPTFGDVDGDGDVDMVMGNEDGRLYFFENNAPADQTLDFSNGFIEMLDANGEVIDVGGNSAPQLFDLTQDGYLDLIIGERNGNINFYSHNGDNNWNYSLTNDSLGNITVDINEDFIGYGIPFMYEYEDHFELIIGNQEGHLLRYDNISGNIDGDFNLVTDHIVDAHLVTRSAPILTEINGDNKPDLIVGNFSGGLDLWIGGTNVGLVENHFNQDTFHVYPNPTNDQFTIQLNTDDASETHIYDCVGKLIFSDKDVRQNHFTIDCSDWSNGIYIVSVVQNGYVSSKKLVVNQHE